MPRSLLTRLHARLSFYEWAYGRLAEADADLGPIAEFLVGSALRCLPPGRRVNAPYDLILPDGRTLEVKATGKRFFRAVGRTPIYRWNVSTQFASRQPLADCWLFLTANFPEKAAETPDFDVFDPKYWTIRVVAGSVLATAGVRRYVTETTLDRLKIPAYSFADPAWQRQVKNA